MRASLQTAQSLEASPALSAAMGLNLSVDSAKDPNSRALSGSRKFQVLTHSVNFDPAAECKALSNLLEILSWVLSGCKLRVQEFAGWATPEPAMGLAPR
jgi:hypothetical protein